MPFVYGSIPSVKFEAFLIKSLICLKKTKIHGSINNENNNNNNVKDLKASETPEEGVKMTRSRKTNGLGK